MTARIRHLSSLIKQIPQGTRQPALRLFRATNSMLARPVAAPEPVQ